MVNIYFLKEVLEMAKKTITPEEYKAKLEKKAAKRGKFSDAFLKALALFLACATVYTTTAMANKKLAAAQGVSSDEESTVDIDADADGIDWGDDSTDGSPNVSPDSSANGEGTSGDNSANDGATSENSLSTKSAQLSYFMTSFANVKKDAKQVVLEKEKGSNYQGIVDAGGSSIIESAGKSLMNSLLKEEIPEDNTFTGEDIKANFPPSGVTCNLKKDDIKSFDFKEEGDYYVVTVVMLKEVNPKQGYGVGSIASILTKESIQDPIKDVPIINKLEPECAYENVSCTAKIEKATGNMVEYYVDMPLILSMKSSSTTYRVGLEFEEWWTISY